MDTRELSDIMLGDAPAKRDAWYKLLKDPVFKPTYNFKSWEQVRDDPFKKLCKVQEHKMVSINDFATDPHNIFTAHEFLAMVDEAAAIKFTVNFNLFGGSVFALSTERHQHYFDKIDDLSGLGCFCLTELGYGNNAVEMETTITYDNATKEFVVHSPSVLSQKYWISNGFKHAKNALVFGQTIVNGKNEGINAFMVPIRDDNLKTYAGVTVNDMGMKFGLNGVDNAALKFNNVRIPRVNMMNRYGDVNEEGKFSHPVENIQSRFFKVTERLLSGRLCIAGISSGATRASLYIAIKYAQQRKSIGIEGESTVPIMDYQLQKNAIMPLLARTFAIQCMYNWAKDVFKNPKGYEQELLSICCIAKTMMGWNCERTVSVCRERCGGMGYLAVSKFASYLACAHASITAEGDNRVLMVKIVKDMITRITKLGGKLPVCSLDPVKQIGTFTDITQLDTLVDLLKFREATLFKRLMVRMNSLKKAGKSAYQVMMREVSDNMQDLAMAYGERNTIETCLVNLASMKNATNKKVMTLVFRLFGIDCVRRDLGFYMVEKVISQEAAGTTNAAYHALINGVAENVDGLINSMNVPVHALYVPIAEDYEKYYSQPNFGEVHGAVDFAKL